MDVGEKLWIWAPPHCLLRWFLQVKSGGRPVNTRARWPESWAQNKSGSRGLAHPLVWPTKNHRVLAKVLLPRPHARAMGRAP